MIRFFHCIRNSRFRFLPAAVLFCSALISAQEGRAGTAVDSSAVQDAVFVISAELGFSGFFVKDAWNPLSVSIENRGEFFDGDLLVTVDAGGAAQGDREKTEYAVRLSSAPGSRKRMQCSVFLPADTMLLTVGLVRDGAALHEAKIPVDLFMSTSGVVLCVSDWPSLDSLVEGNFFKDKEHGIPIAYTDSEFLPESWSSYSGVRALVFHTASLKGMSDSAVDAVRRYARAGGTVLVCGGSPYDREDRRIREELLGTGIGSPEVLTGGSALPLRYIPRSGANSTSPSPDHSKVGTKHPADISVFEYGAGIVVYVPFDYADQALSGYAELSGRVPGIISEAKERDMRVFFRTGETALVSFGAAEPGNPVQFPNPLITIVLLCGYLAWFAFLAFRVRRNKVVSVPALVLPVPLWSVLCASLYAFSLVPKNYLSISASVLSPLKSQSAVYETLDGPKNACTGRFVMQNFLLSSSGGSYSFDIGNSDVFPRNGDTEALRLRTAGPEKGSMRIEGYEAERWKQRRFGAVGMVLFPVSVQRFEADGSVRFRIRASNGIPIRTCAYLERNRACGFGAILPGTDAEYPLAGWKTLSEPDMASVLFSLLIPTDSSAMERYIAEKTILSQFVSQWDTRFPAGSGKGYIVGWMSGSPVEIETEQRFAFEAQGTLFFAELNEDGGSLSW